jgi:hypothetical protein
MRWWGLLINMETRMLASTRSYAVVDDRSSKGVLWRAPSSLQQRVRETAKELDLTQNAYLTTAAIFGELILRRRPEGKPECVIRLVAEMNRVAADSVGDMIVMDACHEKDWHDLQPLLDVLRAANLVGGVREERRPALAPEMVLYAFSFTRDGADVWNVIGRTVLNVLQCSTHHSRP